MWSNAGNVGLPCLCVSHGEGRACRVFFHGSGFCADTRSECPAAAVEADSYFWYLTLKLTLRGVSGPTKLLQHRGFTGPVCSPSCTLWADREIMTNIPYHRDWAARDTVSDRALFPLMHFNVGARRRSNGDRGWGGRCSWRSVAYRFISLHQMIMSGVALRLGPCLLVWSLIRSCYKSHEWDRALKSSQTLLKRQCRRYWQRRLIYTR